VAGERKESGKERIGREEERKGSHFSLKVKREVRRIMRAREE